MIVTGENWRTGIRNCHGATLSTTNPTRTGLESKVLHNLQIDSFLIYQPEDWERCAVHRRRAAPNVIKQITMEDSFKCKKSYFNSVNTRITYTEWWMCLISIKLLTLKCHAVRVKFGIGLLSLRTISRPPPPSPIPGLPNLWHACQQWRAERFPWHAAYTAVPIM